MPTTNGLTKSVWAEFVQHSGEEVFAITHAIYNPSYVEWLESELRAARQKIKEAEQTPTNTASAKLPADIKEKFQRFVDEQVSLPSSFSDVVNEHFWDLI